MRARKPLAFLLSLVMVLALLPGMAAAEGYGDTEGHWAQGAIERWSGYGVVRGDGNGFRPDSEMTRAEAAAVFVNLLGLQDTAGAQAFSDIPADAWYADAIAKASAAGIMSGVGGGMADPNGTVTREMFFVMFARGLGIEPQGATSGAAADGSGWSEGYINALTDRGYVSGDGTGVNALANINRASVMSLMDKTISTYVNTDGANVTASGSGITLIAAKNATVSGQMGDVVVSEGAQGGEVKLDNATVSGTLTLNTGASLELAGTSSVSAVKISEQAENAAVTVDKDAKVETLATEAKDSKISVAGTVDTVDVSESAANTQISTESTATVGEVNTEAAGTSVTGEGKVSTVNTDQADTAVATSGTQKNVTGSSAGSSTAAQTANTTTSGGGGGGSSSGGSSGGGSSSGGGGSSSGGNSSDFGVLKDIAGTKGTTYVNLFDVILDKQYDQLWYDHIAAVVGEENAAATVAGLKGSISSELYGEDAIAQWGDRSNGMAFDCYYINGVKSFTFKGRTATILKTDNTSETHTYRYLGQYQVGEGETMSYMGQEMSVAFPCDVYKSTDEAGEFNYLFMREDTMAETYHIEFRYGKDLKELQGYFVGPYAYWLAAGIDENADAETIENVIALFCLENMDYSAHTDASLRQLDELGFVGTWVADFSGYPEYAGVELYFTIDENGHGLTTMNGETTADFEAYAYDNGQKGDGEGLYVAYSNLEYEAEAARYTMKKNDAGQDVLTFYSDEGVISYVREGTFVLMNIPYEDFYAAENAVDAISSATLNGKARNVNVNGASYHQSEAAVTAEGIAGVMYPVYAGDEALAALKEQGAIEITDASLVTYEMSARGQKSTVELKGKDALQEAPSYSYYVLSDVPASYKKLTLTEGKASFGAASGRAASGGAVTGEVTAPGRHTNVEISLSGLELTPADVSAVTVTTAAGTYALRHVVNIWRGTELGWNLSDLDLGGQTVTKIRYYFKNGSFTDYTAEIAIPNAGFVLMNIPYADFYAAELGENGSVDAISSPTLKFENSDIAAGSYHVTDADTDSESMAIGVTYPVFVTDLTKLNAAYEITDDTAKTINIVSGREKTVTPTEVTGPDALFCAPSYSWYKLSDAPARYKTATVANGSYSFSAVSGRASTVENVTGTASYFTHHGNYVEVRLNDVGLAADAIIGGVIITFDDGSQSALTHVQGIWQKTQIGWPGDSVKGKTIKNVRFITRDSVIDCPTDIAIAIKNAFTGEASADFTGASTVTLSGLPSDIANAKAAVRTKVERGQTATVIADAAAVTGGSFSTTDPAVAGTTYTITVSSDNYADISIELTYSAV